jgi:hypothetical protein
MGQVVEGDKAATLGVDEEELEGALGIVESQGGDDGAGQGRLAGAGGASDEDVGDVGRGKAEEQRDPLLVEAEDGGEWRHSVGAVGPVTGKAAAEGEEGNELALAAGDFDLDLALVAVDAAGGGAKVEGDLLGEPGDLADLDAERGGKVEADEAWGDDATGDTGRHLVTGQYHLDTVGLEVKLAAHGRALLSGTNRPRCQPKEQRHPESEAMNGCVPDLSMVTEHLF